MELHCNKKQVYVIGYLLEYYIQNYKSLLAEIDKAENERKEFDDVYAILRIPKDIAKAIREDIDTFIETNSDEDESWQAADDLKNKIEVELYKSKHGEL